MTESSERLRTASDSLLHDLEALTSLEEEKRELSPDEPRMLELAAQIRELAGRVLKGTRAQEVEAQSIAVAAEIGEAPSIEETPRSMAAILAAWREAERQLAEMNGDTPEAAAQRLHVDGLREEYRRAYEDRERRG